MKLKNNKHGFKVPENYFDEQNMLMGDLESISKVHFKLEVPMGYFERSEHQIEKLIKDQKPKSKLITLLPYYSSIAACFLIALALSQFKEEIDDPAYAKIYFEEQEIPFTTNELFDLTQNQDLEINSIAFENLNNETIFELQEAYNPDFNLIYENYED
ncbi:hypothetical protein OAG30_00720 [Flavobacteriaceae bacterium]|jgi:hypothetical protein|nr:hypothetical protein [Flavobacteriaceae bacterium]MDB4715383.1 hypothetical protein [Flavobacteriaceae bacterium]MDB4773254.1 hypothetical protein [Flavobacteriaceae bacterium]